MSNENSNENTNTPNTSNEQARPSNDDLIERVVKSGRATRESLMWLRSTHVPPAERSELVDAVIALGAKMSTSPFHLHRLLTEAAWLITNVLGLEVRTSTLMLDLAKAPPDVPMRRSLTARLVQLRDSRIELMQPEQPDEDEIDRAAALAGYIATRWRLGDPALVVEMLVQSIAYVCTTSSDPDKAMEISIDMLTKIRELFNEGANAAGGGK